MRQYALGLDYGTGSARALIVDLDSGAEVGSAECAYAHGEDGVIVDSGDPNFARQHPGDYLDALSVIVRDAVARAVAEHGITPEQIVGVGVDTTGSTPIPVDADGRALAESDRFAAAPGAMAWLWKDHTAQAEAEQITELAQQRRPEYLARCGGTYSSEWFWSKVLRCARVHPEVFAAAHSFVELCDFIPGYLCGVRRPDQLRRSVCAAGHKAMFATEWGGLPDAEFLGQLAPELAPLRERLFSVARTADQPAGVLHDRRADELGLAPGTPVAVGAFDAHLGAVGAGIRPGELVKVIGTSTCDMAVAALDEAPNIDGLCGIVDGSILPGYFGFEAGQSAVGDVFDWCRKHLSSRDHAALNADAAGLRPGETGLMALDWHNGNRCLLVDPALSGLVVGLSLHTGDHELYRAMIEATAFGARMIIDRLVASGVPIESIVACGGIATKSPLVLQIYADVLQRPVQVATSSETCALGAAIMGAVAAGRFASVERAQATLCPARDVGHTPDAAAAATYDRLFGLYRDLHDSFGAGARDRDLGRVMKELLSLRASARGAESGL